jgi:hypothetical protein
MRSLCISLSVVKHSPTEKSLLLLAYFPYFVNIFASGPYRNCLLHKSLTSAIEVQLHVFLTSALDRGVWSASLSGRFTGQGKSLQYPLDRSLGEPQSWSERHEGKNILAPTDACNHLPVHTVHKPYECDMNIHHHETLKFQMRIL